MSNFIDFTDPFWDDEYDSWVPDTYTRCVTQAECYGRAFQCIENSHKFIVDFKPDEVLSVYFFNDKFPKLYKFEDIDWRLSYNYNGILTEDVPIAYKLYVEQL